MRALFRQILLVLLALAPLAARGQVNTDQVIKIGQNALYFDDYMVAIQYFNQAIQSKPWLAQPYFLRAVAKISLDDYAGAEADASAAIERNPFITDAYEVRGVSRQNLGLNSAAIDDYARVLQDKPDNRNVLYNKALAELQTDRREDAAETFGTLIRRFPNYDGGFIARARYNIIEGDTLAALADASRAIKLNANGANAYLMRAEIYSASPDSLKLALADMDMAVKLLPQAAGLYINRAYLRYRDDDYVGAMEDFDHSLSLEPANIVALYNRGMLRAEVHDFSRSIDDLSAVLRQQPRQYRALFNRANLYRELGDYENALADINAVIDAFPDFAAAVYLRGDILFHKGQSRAADADFGRSIALAKKKVVMLPDSDIGAQDDAQLNDSTGIFGESQEAVAQRFSSLLRVENLADSPRDYAAVSTRGKIQDSDFAVQLEPLYTLAYHAEESTVKLSADYVREVDNINASRALSFPILVTCHEAANDEETISRHLNSIRIYDNFIASGQPRPIDYFGRAMDYVTLRNYHDAKADLDRAVAASPDFALALFMRAVVTLKILEAEQNSPDALRGKDAAMLRSAAISSALDDLDAAIRLSPGMAIAYYNKGCVMALEADYAGALDAFSRAISFNPDLGEAYYNRGYINMTLGNKADAFSDLSRAGQLGIAPSYNLIKRMSR